MVTFVPVAKSRLKILTTRSFFVFVHSQAYHMANRPCQCFCHWYDLSEISPKAKGGIYRPLWKWCGNHVTDVGKYSKKKKEFELRNGILSEVLSSSTLYLKQLIPVMMWACNLLLSLPGQCQEDSEIHNNHVHLKGYSATSWFVELLNLFNQLLTFISITTDGTISNIQWGRASLWQPSPNWWRLNQHSNACRTSVIWSDRSASHKPCAAGSNFLLRQHFDLVCQSQSIIFWYYILISFVAYPFV